MGESPMAFVISSLPRQLQLGLSWEVKSNHKEHQGHEENMDGVHVLSSLNANLFVIFVPFVVESLFYR
jgi:hypothetical protein